MTNEENPFFEKLKLQGGRREMNFFANGHVYAKIENKIENI